MSGCCGGNSLFDTGGGIIKYQGNDLVSIEGSNILERLPLGIVSIPYKQILKGRIILKPGEDNYLMNHLGLGNNATLVAMVVKYNPKSKLEIDNYVEFEYVTNPGIKFPIAQILTLNGNSIHRIPQLLLSNPNELYSVTIDVMVATVDEQSSEFSTIPPVITFVDEVSIYNGTTTLPGTPSSAAASLFSYTTTAVLWATFDKNTLISTVTDDIDTIANSNVRFEAISRLPLDINLPPQSITYNVSVVDLSYNLTEVELKVNITY